MKESDKKYKVMIPDTEYYAKLVRCRLACPVGTDAGSYVQAIAEGRYEDAYLIIRRTNPFASICGRICQHPCEIGCNRASIDDAVAIRALKRFITEKYGVEGVKDVWTTLRYSGAPGYDSGYNTGEKVAVIGSGPGGLTAAHDLARLGYKVTVFESLPIVGGMFYIGIPPYRLPRDLVDAEINAILSLGIEVKTNITIGKDISIRDLKRAGYQAIVIAIGAQQNISLKIEGEDLEGVVSAVSLLKALNLGEDIWIGERAAVIGGGFTAFDSARSLLRAGSKDVKIIYRRTIEEIPAAREEVLEAEEEGVDLNFLVAPKRIIGENGRVKGIECIRMKMGERDRSGRRSPVPIPDSEFVIPVDQVVIAIGQYSDSSWVEELKGIEITRWGTISVDSETMSTRGEGVFAAGDVATGPSVVISAVASAQKAARSVDMYLSGRKSIIKKVTRIIPQDIRSHTFNNGFIDMDRDRVDPPVIETEKRMNNRDEEVEQTYPEEQAKEQAMRCLKCHINTIFDADKCILCGGCVDICPEYCLKMVSLDEIETDDNILKLLNKGCDVLKDGIDEKKRIELLNQGTAMIKDEDRCIRCGLCARRCPTNAINMERLEYEEVISYEEG
ncbi:MAG: FAD-dependent oxidoreductase [Nitrospirota bacterium]